MRLPVPAAGGDFQPAPAGSFRAVCYRFLDLGSQPAFEPGKPPAHKILLSFELSDEKDDSGKPFMVAQRFTWSMHEKSKLRPFLESWRGRAFTDADFGPEGFDTKKLLGVPCILTIVHESKGDKTYANIAAIGPLMKGMERPKPINQPVYLAFDEWNQSVYEGLSDGLKKVISDSPEYKKLKSPASSNDAHPADYGDGQGYAGPSEEESIPF